jgi:hypothetical protein
VARPSQGLAPPGLVWHLGPISLTSSSLGASQGKILMPKKSQVNLSTGRFLKHKNTQNGVFLFCRVITKIRGSMENSHKSLQIMIITTNNIIICRICINKLQSSCMYVACINSLQILFGFYWISNLVSTFGMGRHLHWIFLFYS